MENIVVETSTDKDIVDITDLAQGNIGSLKNGVIVLNVLHTTAALTTADLDPGTDQDLLDFLAAITPSIEWRHPHNPEHAPSHLLSSVIGASVSIVVRGGILQLGQWQRVVLVELDGPRQRNIACYTVS